MAVKPPIIQPISTMSTARSPGAIPAGGLPLSHVAPTKVVPGPTTTVRKPPVPLDAHQIHLNHEAHLAALARHPALAPKVPLSAHQKHLAYLKKHPELDINKYLTNDVDYQNQMAALLKATGDYRAQELNAENRYNTGYALNRNDIAEQQRLSGIDQQEDYASRGMIRSGLYGVANADRLTGYANQYAKIDNDKANYTGDLRTQMTNYLASQQLSQQQARQDAIHRHALSLIK